MSENTPESPSFWDRLPSFIWILIFIGGIVAVIGGMIGLFYLLSRVEGFASLLLLVIAWIALRAGSSDQPKHAEPGSGFVTAIGITFFALMGLAIDQTGNPIYNQPMEWLFCPSGTQLERGVNVTHPTPGRTNVSQDFTCVTEEGRREVKSLRFLEVVGVRLIEYVLIGYGLLGLSRLYTRFRAAQRG